MSEYSPIGIEIKTEIPNANDFVYIFEVKIPEENNDLKNEKKHCFRILNYLN